MDNNKEGERTKNANLDTNQEGDRRTRRFAEVTLPENLKPISDRLVPSTKVLGPLENLVGVWKGKKTGWNMIALPFQHTHFKFRILMNHYSEELKFVFIDDDVPNRGLSRPDDSDNDQSVVTLDYQQKIAQDHAEDRPDSGGLAGKKGLPIHHEPGLWLYDRNRKFKVDQIKEDVVSQVDFDVARLASIPHGNSVLAIGKSEVYKGMPEIPPLSGLPSGRFEDVLTPDYDFRSDPYLEPYKHYIDFPYKGDFAGDPTFPGFSPADMNHLLRVANVGVNIVQTTVLTVDSDQKPAGITNAPFSTREAEPVSMKSTFWIQEIEDPKTGERSMRLQYSQVVMLHFFHPREDEFPGRAVWPHISIATLGKIPFDYKLVQG